ncbi:splicing factor 45 [Plodia interpunctella]|uniref:splicing factor 45 n=1 Tax=Plodia interpunctella TaxID=58824 RepID=UPI00236837A7|nr:splicing factor 45 [Plodia interpunctella]
MSLYDDVDTIKARTTEKVAGWSSGIKLLQSQLQLKKAAITQPKREAARRSAQVLTPVIDLKSKPKDEDESNSNSPQMQTKTLTSLNVRDFDWNVANEYDPMWPNDYEKVAKEMQAKRLQSDGNDRSDRSDRKRKSRFGDDEDTIPEKTLIPMQPEEEEAEEITKRSVGAAIAPPPSLTAESVSPPPPAAPVAPTPSPGFSLGGYGASSIAAKIMAKYGFKEGQGLGKKEQGMSVALQVEKTSKRGGRIIHEKDSNVMPPPGFAVPALPGPDSPNSSSQNKQEPSITEIMKSPSKVVLLRNMVGPGDVDEELEPEVKDECNTKYGDVIKVLIFELPNAPPDEAVRIFVEFKRIESAIKAVVDLNGRFFGGRQVKAGFYDVEKFNSLKLTE